MILSDREIRDALAAGHIGIDPIDNPGVQIQPASVDLRLGNRFVIFRHVFAYQRGGVDASPLQRSERWLIANENVRSRQQPSQNFRA